MGDDRNIHVTAAGTFRVRWYDQHGRQHGKTFKTKPEAKAWLKEVEGLVVQGTYRDPKRAKVRLRDWVAECRRVDFKLSEGTIEIEKRVAERIGKSDLGAMPLKNIDSSAIEEYIATRLAEGAAPGYVSIEFRSIRKWLNRAVAKDRIAKNPCAEVEPPKSDDEEMRFLTMEQLVVLSEAMPARYRAWVLTAGVLGLRYSELNGLRRRNVKLLERKVDVVEQLLFRNGEWKRSPRLKTDSSRRSVTVGSPLLEILAQHIGDYALPGDDGLVFPNRNGQPLGPSTFRGTFQRALERAGLPPEFRIHDLRHTAVALAIAAGAHPMAIQRRMGHSDITVTLGTYGHLFPELDEALADELGTKLDVAMKTVVPLRRPSLARGA